MDRRILTSGLGVVAAVALLVSNGTFATWSDSYTDSGNQVGASELTLNVGASGTAEFDKMNLYPGGQADFEFVVASRDAGSVPLADLVLQIMNLDDIEDGCTSTSSEAAADVVGTPCTDTGSPGDFASNAKVTVNASAPTTDTVNACNSSAHPRGSKLPGGVSTLKQLFDWGGSNGGLNLLPAGDSLEPGEGICVAMALSLPTTVGNEVQGDSASFDIKFDLTQVI